MPTCPSYLRLLGYGNHERLVRCARMDEGHEVHLDSLNGGTQRLTWRDGAPGAVHPLQASGPVSRTAPHPDLPELVRHGKCANVVCPNRANEGQMVTFVLPHGTRRPVALILCAGCGEALARECGGS